MTRTEDEVRNAAKDILGFENNDDVISGVGQITTFNQLGFDKIKDKPDGWYLPQKKYDTAIILEVKSEKKVLESTACIKEIKKNCSIVMSKYKNVIGILYNGVNTLGFLNNEAITVPRELQKKDFYINLLKDEPIDKKKIYKITAKINNNLHFNFGIKNLYHRMVFTACALVTERYSQDALMKNMNYDVLRNSISSNLNKSLEHSKNQNHKIETLVSVFSEIQSSYPESQLNINNFILDVKKISNAINSNHWRGEDVMGIFFNEFNRYKKKTESGQVFTPDHITNFMYNLLDCDMNDCILDATCGSGAFLTKAMSNMIEEAGGINTAKAKEIKANQLYGIEFDKQIYALACANMLIHKDGKTNIELLDAKSIEAGSWISSKPITKVLMNPPFEKKYKCMEIISNVLNNVRRGTMCAFILPEKKFETESKKRVKEILSKHRIIKIIKLPEKLFSEGVTTSIFVMEAGKPQNKKTITAYNIEDDGLETVKNQGRHDVKNKWDKIEKEWLESIEKSEHETKQILNPNEHLSWQTPEKEFIITNEDFKKTIMHFEMYKENLNINELNAKLSNIIKYNSDITEDDENNILIKIKKED